MEIHAPERPIHSLKDFGIHIAIVTIGILIALGLEGTREVLHERHLVRETRANFHNEMQTSRQNMTDELARVTAGDMALKKLAQEAPMLAQSHPEQVVARLEAIQNPYYFFSTNSWQASLSTGALALMPPEEVSRYAWAAEGTRIYTGLQAQAMDAETHAIAYWRAHPHPAPAEIAEGEECILVFARAERSLAYVAPQTQGGFQHALDAAAH